ncbi:hypothetical protein [Pseudarthrobacter sp. H2]|uniref:hypothetical protein n=1 Tax=Pseudarthrobacter sp. H2 TaxID=3418415 RepID=UPI003CEE9378
MRSAVSPIQADDRRAAPFTGSDICGEAGLTLPPDTYRPVFEEDLWDFTDVVGLPVDMALANRRFDFAAITDPRWRMVAKELVLALLAPRHEAVALLPRAYRTPLHLRSCNGRLKEITRFFAWLAQRGLPSLEHLETADCEAYLGHRRYIVDDEGVVVGEQSHGIRRTAAQVIVDLVNYRELFTADRVRTDLRPWGGATASAVAEMPSGRTGNATEPVPDHVLQPILAAALHLVGVLGPHVIELQQQVRAVDRVSSLKAAGLRHSSPSFPEDIKAVLAQYTSAGTGLPMMEDHDIAARIADGWAAEDPLLPLATGALARTAGYSQFWARWIPTMRGPLEQAVASVGVEKVFGRDAADTPAADGSGTLPWTLPLHRSQAVALIGTVRTASIIVLAAVSGMRPGPDPGRIRAPEWILYRAVELAERLHEDAHDGAPLFGRFAFSVRYAWFRAWVNSPAGADRPGPDPGRPDMLRRTLSLEMAYRPGGVLATKIHLKHIAVATTEGYSSRPGGAQAMLLAEVNKNEADRNLELVLAEFRNYQQGILPAGPGARALTEFFASIDGTPNEGSAPAPTIQRNDRDILNLLSKRAKVLHLGPANYCWFTDPSRALCLKLAGTPAATRPLAGMCDSARCPQATHHLAHRPVWAEHAASTKAFLGQLGKTRTAERTRLSGDYDRALRVIAEIDVASSQITKEDDA